MHGQLNVKYLSCMSMAWRFAVTRMSAASLSVPSNAFRSRTWESRVHFLTTLMCPSLRFFHLESARHLKPGKGEVYLFLSNLFSTPADLLTLQKHSKTPKTRNKDIFLQHSVLMLSNYGKRLSCALPFPCKMMIYKSYTFCLILLGSIIVLPATKKYDAVRTDKYVPNFQRSLLMALDCPDINNTFLRKDDS